MIQAILFDFNGVIINDEPLHMKAYQEALRAEGIQLTDEEYFNSLGMDDQTFVRAAFARSGLPLDDEKMHAVIEGESKLHRVMIEDELPLVPGVVTFIKAAARHYLLGIVSMSRRTQIDYVLDRVKLSDLFSAIISAEMIHACKPDPECYNRGFLLVDEKRRAAGKLSLSPDECLVIEDAPPGIRAARAAGMHTLGVTNTVSADALRAAGAEVVTASLADWTTDTVHYIYDRAGR
ncbi:MAG: HAD family phosphatase [Pyrinomonadaceae bacterium]|nr:HAD family phosphatase [Pyrinomonadaceae bacterium]